MKYFLAKVNAKARVNLIQAVFLISKDLDYTKENHLDSELSIFSMRQYRLIYETVACPDGWEQIQEILKKPAIDYCYGMLAYNVKAITNPELFSLSRTIKCENDIRDELTESLTQFAKDYFKPKLSKYIFYDFLGLIAWTKLDDGLKKFILDEVKRDNDILFQILDIYARPMFVNIKTLDDALGYNKLRKIVEGKIKSKQLTEDKLSKVDEDRLNVFLNYDKDNTSKF